jgi:Transposase
LISAEAVLGLPQYETTAIKDKSPPRLTWVLGPACALATAEVPAKNGIAEGVHTKMEVLQRQSYGLRNSKTIACALGNVFFVSCCSG